jgi:hypothetical protein
MKILFSIYVDDLETNGELIKIDGAYCRSEYDGAPANQCRYTLDLSC